MRNLSLSSRKSTMRKGIEATEFLGVLKNKTPHKYDRIKVSILSNLQAPASYIEDDSIISNIKLCTLSQNKGTPESVDNGINTKFNNRINTN